MYVLKLRQTIDLLIVLGGVSVQTGNTFLITTMMPSISQELGAVDRISWPMVASLSISIVGAAVAPFVTSTLGRNQAYALVFILYGLGTIGSALSTTFDLFTAFRGLQGFAGGMLVAFSYALIPTLFEKNKIGKVFAFTSLVWGAGAFVGPLVGSFWVNAGLWRLGLCSFLPMTLIVMGLVVASKHLQLPKNLEVPGFAWSTLLALILSIWVIASSSGNFPVSTKYVLLVVGLLVFIAFLVKDSFAKDSLFPSLKREHSASPKVITVLMFALCSANSSISIYVPLIAQKAFGTSVMLAGYFHSLEAIAWSVAALAAVNYSRIQPLHYVRIGTILMAAGMFLLALSIPATSFSKAILAILCCGSGMGLMWSHATSIVVNSVKSELAEATSASLSTIQLLAYGFSAALSGTIINLRDSTTPQTAEHLTLGSQNLFFFFCVTSIAAFAATITRNRHQQNPST